MAKLIDYPRSSFKKALSLADAVASLGGRCSIEISADKMGMKVSGSFQALYGSAQRFNLLFVSKGTLNVSELYKQIRHSYSDQERRSNKIKAFLSPAVFKHLYEKFLGLELPTEMLDKILIREFGIDELIAGRISNYFVDGCKDLQLLDNGILIDPDEKTKTDESEPGQKSSEPIPVSNSISYEMINQDQLPDRSVSESADYQISIVGPNINFKMIIKELDDIQLLEGMIKKMKKKLNINE
jgi:hypothetical protein